MSGYGFLGAMKGIGEAGKKFGEAVTEDAFEERRQQRIEERQIEREKRAATEHDRQRQAAIRDRFGEDFDPAEGTFMAERRKGAEFELGDAYDPSKGAYGSKLDIDWDDWVAKQEFGNDEWDRRLAAETGAQFERAKNSETAKGTWKLKFNDSLGWHEENSSSGQTRSISAGAGAKEKDGSGASGSGAKVTDASLNHGYQAIAKQFGGSYDDDILKVPSPEAREQVMTAYDIFTRLVYEGVETGRATYIALDTVSMMVSEKDARAQATEESKSVSGRAARREFVERRTQELREEGMSGINAVREQTDRLRDQRNRGLLDPGTDGEQGETFRANDGSTITMAEIEATAQQHGQTPEQVIQNLRERGIIVGD
jgi:hypothetical protein